MDCRRLCCRAVATRPTSRGLFISVALLFLAHVALVSVNNSTANAQSSGSKAPDDSAPVYDAVKELSFFDEGDGMAVSVDGKRLIFSGANNADTPGLSRIVIYDVVAGKTLHQFEARHNFVPVAMGRDGRFAAYVDQANIIRVVDVASGRALGELRDDKLTSGDTDHIVFAPDGKSLWTQYQSRENRPSAFLGWSLTNGAKLPPVTVDGITPSCLAFFPKGKRLAVGYRNGDLRVWDMQTGKSTSWQSGPLPEPSGDKVSADEIRSIAISSDGKYLVSGVMDRHAQLWDATTGKPIRKLITYGPLLPVLTDFDPKSRVVLCQGAWLTADGRNNFVADGNPIHVFDVKTGERLAYLHLPGPKTDEKTACGIGWADQGRQLYVGTGAGKVKIFDTTAWLKP